MLRIATALVLATMTVSILSAQDGIKGTKRPGPVKVDEFNDRAPVKPKQGGDLTIATQVAFRLLDADMDNSSTTSEALHGYVQENLVTSDNETWKPKAGLAETWDIEDVLETKDGKLIRGKVTEADGKYEVKTLAGEPLQTLPKEDAKDVRYQTAFTFHLRKGVTFHNGDPFTAKDVEFTWKMLRDPRNGMPNIQNYVNDVTECTIVDDFTVRMTYNRQYWMALTAVGGYVYIRPHKAWDPDGMIDKNPDEFFKKLQEHPLLMNPIGTGPYAFDSYRKDFELVLKRYDGYWNKSNPQYPDRLRFRVIKDVVAQLQALKNGEVDYIESTIPPQEWEDFFKDKENVKNFGAVEMIYPSFGYIGWNMRKDLWKDKKVRWAMSYGAVDIDRFIPKVLNGKAERVTGDWYMYSDSYNTKLKPIPYDPKKAEELLAEAGWWDSDGDGILDKDGKKFEFEMLVRDMPPTMPAIQMLLEMQANLKAFGIKMEIRKLEWGGFLDKIEHGDFDACRLGWALSSPPNHQDCFQIWHSSQIGENGSNHVSFANPELDKLLEECRKELDEEKRRAMEFRIQEILYEEQPEIYLYMAAELRAYSKKWRGVRFYVPRPGHLLYQWYLGE